MQQCFKELRRSIAENGIHSSLTKGIIEAIGIGYTMTPWDWKALVKTAHPCTTCWIVQSTCNFDLGIPIRAETLQGIGQYPTVQRQTQVDCRVFPQCSTIAAWSRVPPLPL